MPRPSTADRAPSDVCTLLASSGGSFPIMRFARGAVLFAQGDRADSVLFLHKGTVTLSVLSAIGKEAVVGILAPGDFFGEGCLAGQPQRMATATALTATAALRIPKAEMQRTLYEQHEFADRFIAHVLARNIRIEEDLVDQLTNSIEKRLARKLLLLPRFGAQAMTERSVPHLSQETLAEMVGTTRSRVNFFMNKFRKLGYIDYDGGRLTIRNSSLSTVLHD